jgi:hypothetical protein
LLSASWGRTLASICKEASGGICAEPVRLLTKMRVTGTRISFVVSSS